MDNDKVQTYADYIKSQEGQRHDANITASVNSLAGLGGTIGIGSIIAGKPNVGIPITTGTAGAMLGYHGANILGWRASSRLLAAALMGAASAVTGSYYAGEHK